MHGESRMDGREGERAGHKKKVALDAAVSQTCTVFEKRDAGMGGDRQREREKKCVCGARAKVGGGEQKGGETVLPLIAESQNAESQAKTAILKTSKTQILHSVGRRRVIKKEKPKTHEYPRRCGHIDLS